MIIRGPVNGLRNMYEKEFYNFNRQAIGILCLVYPLVIINFNIFLLYKKLRTFHLCVLIISLVGSTPLGMYKKLIEFHKKGELSFKYVETFNMDEYVGETHSRD